MHLAWEELNTHRGRLRGRKRQLGKRAAFRWSHPPRDTSAPAPEAGPVVAPCSFSLPSLAPPPSSPVYTDETPAPTARTRISSRSVDCICPSLCVILLCPLRGEHKQVVLVRRRMEERQKASLNLNTNTI